MRGLGFGDEALFDFAFEDGVEIVDGQDHGLEPGRFRVDGSAGEADLPECVMSFAYWNPAFLDQGRLLNTQNGEFLDVEISQPVAEQLLVRGEQQLYLQQPGYGTSYVTGKIQIEELLAEVALQRGEDFIQ